MANKVQLMKIKNKAGGLKTIPTTDRIYFNVSFCDSNKLERTTPLFVSSQWTVGRAIDAIAQEMKLINNNNKSTEKKLRLFRKVNKEIVSEGVHVLLRDLVTKKVILDGENLIIQYVQDDCVKLED